MPPAARVGKRAVRRRLRAFPVVVAIAAFIALSKYKTDIMQVIGVWALLGLAYSLFM